MDLNPSTLVHVLQTIMYYLCLIFTSPLADLPLNRVVGSSRSACWSNKDSNPARANVELIKGLV